MDKATLWAVEWLQGAETLMAMEPDAGELRRVAPALAAFYNDDHNRRMMAHDGEPHTPDDVVAYYEALRAEGGRPFLLYQDGVLRGDADFRNIVGDRGEFAIMIGAQAAQGRGLGTRFARMLHAFGFGTLGLARVYISVIPDNVASRRLFEKLGYRIDDGPEARALIDEPSDVTMSLPRAAFDLARTDGEGALRVFERPASA